jgi:CheY-like chemotaxis protein
MSSMENISRKTILLIDDEQYICQVVQTCIELFSDWQPLTVPCCEEGLAAVANVRPDVILLDMLMPNMDGFAFLKTLQANPEFADIPVILLTSRVDLTESQKITQLGVKGAIAKPFHPVQIVSQITRILGW